MSSAPEPRPEDPALRRLPVFPLGTVVVPGSTVPLHVFEDRYRALVHHLLRLEPEQRLFATVAIREGYEVGDRGTQSVHRVGSVLQLTEAQELPDGRFEVVCVARQRLRLEAMDTSGPYLVGSARLLGDDEPAPGSEEARAEEAALAETLVVFGSYRDALGQLHGGVVLEGEVPRTPLWASYALTAACLLTLRERQALLEADDTLTRLGMLRLAMREEMRAMRAVPSMPATEVARTRWSPN